LVRVLTADDSFRRKLERQLRDATVLIIEHLADDNALDTDIRARKPIKTLRIGLAHLSREQQRIAHTLIKEMFPDDIVEKAGEVLWPD
jgi:hypothetical protein